MYAGGLQTPFSAKVNAGESTHCDDCACNNKPRFLLGLPLQPPLNSIFLFPLPSPKGSEVRTVFPRALSAKQDATDTG